MIKIKLEITNRLGIHARPAVLLLKAVSMWNAKASVYNNGMKANLNNVMEVLALGVKKGNVVEFEFDGVEEKLVSEEVSRLVNEKFYEK